MANSTFNGPVRSENNFKVISRTASTGLISDRTVQSGMKDSRRYYLDEWFNQLPALNSYLEASETRPVDAALLTILKLFSDRTGPLNVLFAIL